MSLKKIAPSPEQQQQSPRTLETEVHHAVTARAGRPGAGCAVAAHLGVSRRLLYLRFSELVGKSVLKTITETRVALLKDRLRISKEPVARLSLKCGFKTAKNAKRVFKAATSLSMREWRNRNTV